ncbi:uncharacterized protein LOC110238377 [Exaiptasia diaphana]|uniref:Uncharacterized protein n=1 Tax=Exaiptasia diaphana TaxID=2652724 RepID=A0A913X6G7_EXADI|nr:uncharacterized protein LOC110238377 [Exaiptasia diaphana]KXJ14779.1 hypothetical protein AC249_AIPGENE24475 [Exaiptasia diaphana]
MRCKCFILVIISKFSYLFSSAAENVLLTSSIKDNACIPVQQKDISCTTLCYCIGPGIKDNDSALYKLVIWSILFTRLNDCKPSFTMSVVFSLNKDKLIYDGDISKQGQDEMIWKAHWLSKSNWDIDMIKNISKVEIFIYNLKSSLPEHSLYISCPRKSGKMFLDHQVCSYGCN